VAYNPRWHIYNNYSQVAYNPRWHIYNNYSHIIIIIIIHPGCSMRDRMLVTPNIIGQKKDRYLARVSILLSLVF
jgi:hypothetical protein